MALFVLTATGTAVASVHHEAVPVAHTSNWTLTRTSDGLLLDQPFTKPINDRVLQDGYEFNGDLDPSRAFVHATGEGLRVGVQPPNGAADFMGWFAVTLDAYPKDSIFHVRMSKPKGNVAGPGREAEAVFAVQTASTKITGLINFVEVTSDSLNSQTAWQVDYSWGKVQNAKTQLYWRTHSTNDAPSTEDITLRTDGSHALSIWLGPRRIFDSKNLHLDMQVPLQPYLEVQALDVPYVATFQDFWVTRGNTLMISGVPAGAVVTLTTAEGVLARETATSGGAVALTLPPYAATGTGRLTIAQPGRFHADLGPFRYAGGDTFTLAHK